MDEELRKLKKAEAEIAARVLTGYHAEKLAGVISRAATACRDVLLAYKDLEAVGLNERADPVAWVDRTHEFFRRLSVLELILAEREALNGIDEALCALLKGGESDGH